MIKYNEKGIGDGEEFAQIMIDSFQIIGFSVSLGLYHISSFSSSGICTS